MRPNCNQFVCCLVFYVEMVYSHTESVKPYLHTLSPLCRYVVKYVVKCVVKWLLNCLIQNELLKFSARWGCFPSL